MFHLLKFVQGISPPPCKKKITDKWGGQKEVAMRYDKRNRDRIRVNGRLYEAVNRGGISEGNFRLDWSQDDGICRFYSNRWKTSIDFNPSYDRDGYTNIQVIFNEGRMSNRVKNIIAQSETKLDTEDTDPRDENVPKSYVKVVKQVDDALDVSVMPCHFHGAVA